MKLPNGYGTVYKLSGKRRKPFVAKRTIGWEIVDGKAKQKYMVIGYYEKREEAFMALSEYNSNPYDIEKSKTTFEELYTKWSKSHFSKVSKQAITNYTVAYKYCSSLYSLPFRDIKTAHCQAVIDNSQKAFPTRKLIKTLLNQLYDYGIQNDIVDKKYSSYVDIGKNEGKLKRKPFTANEIQTLFDNVNNMDYVDTIIILIYTGLRIGELLTIKKENVFIEEKYMIGGIKTEAGKDRVIPIHDKIIPYIKKWYSKKSIWLITNSKGEQMQYSNYKREKFDNIMEQLKMKHNPHDTRHTFASLMDTAGANKLCIKRIMGHSSQDITDKVYTHKDISELIEAIQLLK